MLGNAIRQPGATGPAGPTSAGNGRQAVESVIECVSAQKVEAEHVRWLWPLRIPLGKLSVFFGMPGGGKSTAATDVAARVTTGQAWPDTANNLEPSDVVMLCAEDDLKDTVKPRLMAAGANLGRVHFAIRTTITFNAKKSERHIAFDQDMAAMSRLLAKNPHIRLVVIDPLASYLGKLSKIADKDMRPVLEALKNLAERHNVAVLTIDHFNKNIEQAALHRLSGAGALNAVPRALWAFTRDNNDKSAHHMLNAKMNITSEEQQAGMKFKFRSTEVMIKGSPASLATIEWGGKSDESLDDVLNSQTNPKEKREAKARRFLQEYLADGPRPSKEIEMPQLKKASATTQCGKPKRPSTSEPIKPARVEAGIGA